MTIDETSLLRDRYLQDDISSAEKAFFLMGSIQALRDLFELAKAGSGPVSETIMLLALGKEQTILEQLRKI